MLGCLGAPRAGVPESRKRPSDAVAEMAKRGAYPPPSLDGALLHAHNVDLQLPHACAPLDEAAMVHVSQLVDDNESSLLAACNILETERDTGKKGPKVTLVLMRHLVQIETGEVAAASLRRSPGMLDVALTTLAPTLSGATLGPEAVVAMNAPTSIGARPSASLWFGAQDGLYVLYVEVDSDAESLAEWAGSLTEQLRPTSAAHPLHWRAPTRLAPSSTAVGPFRIQLPEQVSAVEHTFGDLIGDPHDPLDVRHARSLATFRDESGVALGGAAYRATLLAPIASTPEALAKMIAESRGVTELEEASLSTKAGLVARVQGVNAAGDHEVYATFREAIGPADRADGDCVVVHLVIAKERWEAYAPLIDASLATLSMGDVGGGPY